MTHERNNTPDTDAERIAHHLDGRGGSLDASAAEAADEIRRVEAWLGSMLDVEVPQQVLDSAYRDLAAAMAVGTKPRRWRVWTLVATSAVAAALALAIVLNAVVVDPPQSIAEVAEEVEAFLDEDPSALDLQIAMLDDEFTLTWAEWVLDDEFGETSAMDAIDQGLEDLWFVDPEDASYEYEI